MDIGHVGLLVGVGGRTRPMLPLGAGAKCRQIGRQALSTAFFLARAFAARSPGTAEHLGSHFCSTLPSVLTVVGLNL